MLNERPDDFDDDKDEYEPGVDGPMVQEEPLDYPVPDIDPDLEMFRRSFTNIRPEGDQIERIEALRDEYTNVLNAVCMVSDRTPNRTIALRKLEESLMYAVKNIVMES